MAILTGTTGNDTLNGTTGTDSISGLAGDDQITGLEGNDTLVGGYGYDYLYGGLGDDLLVAGDQGTNIDDTGYNRNQLFGEDGNDTLIGSNYVYQYGGNGDYLYGGSGNDSLSGLAGDDILYGDAEDDILDGGDGNDNLEGGAGNDTLYGGTGNDYFADNVDSDTYDGGDGNDIFSFRSSNISANATVTGGNGSDTYILQPSYLGNDFIVNDFVAGAGGDVIDYSLLLSNWSYTAGNPFGTAGYLKIIQDTVTPANTLVQLDSNGGGDLWKTVLTLQKVIATNLTAANFNLPFPIDGTAISGVFGNSTADSINGSAASDLIYGLSGDDTINGLEGNDTLDGGYGSDQLHGGLGDDSLIGGTDNNYNYNGYGYGENQLYGDEGNDTLFGGNNSDTLDGGIGNDSLSGLDGYDNLTGGGGNDTLIGGDNYDQLHGGLGDDLLIGGTQGSNVDIQSNWLNGEDGNDTLIGGDYVSGNSQDDYLNGGAGNDSLSGLAGNDYIDGGAGDDTLDGGAGDDRLYDYEGNNVLNGGDGNDLLYLYSNSIATSSTLTGGAGSDHYEVNNWNASQFIVADFSVGVGVDVIDVSSYIGNTSSNPFAANGSLQLVQSGSDTLLQQADYNPTLVWTTVLTLKNVIATNLTIDNFAPRVEPNGSAVVAITANGDANDNYLDGSTLNDSLSGLAGDDTLKGFSGNDTLIGDDGNDQLYGGAGDDSLVGGAGYNQLYGDAGNDTLIGGNDENYFSDQQGNNLIIGGDGSDNFSVGSWNPTDISTLTGGAGRDYFNADSYNVYDTYNNSTTPRNGTVLITDFNAGASGDYIQLYSLLNNGQSIGYTNSAIGYLRLIQNGNDALFQWDKDGASGSTYNWVTLLTLQNLNLTSTPLTADNFYPNFSVLMGTDGNYAPIITEPYLNQGIAYGKPWSFDLTNHFTDSDNSVLTYSSTNLPTWLSISSNGSLVGTPPSKAFDQVSPITITATDPGGLSTSADFSVTVLNFDAGNLFVSTSATETITGTSGIDTVSYKNAPNGVSVSLATLSNIENIIGSNSADTLIDNASITNSTLAGGLDNDIYTISNSTTKIIETSLGGTLDSVESSVNYTLPAFVENLTLTGADTLNATGNNSANTLIGNEGNNRLDGRIGRDTMQGGAGNDVYIVDNKGDVVQEESAGGNDLIQSSTNYILPDNVENLTLTGRLVINGTGNNLDNVIFGNSGNNKLMGMAGDDILLGGAGNDKLVGGSGRDVIDSGTGADKIILNSLAIDADTIIGFVTGIDVLDLSASLTPATLTIGTQIAHTGTSETDIAAITTAANTDAEVYYISNTAVSTTLTLAEIETALTAGSAATGQATILLDNGADTLIYFDAAIQTDAGSGAGLVLIGTLVGVTGTTALATGDLISI